jgi:hypothetical protein
LRIRYIDLLECWDFCWDQLDISDPLKPSFKVMSATRPNMDYSNLFLAKDGGLLGADYPYRDENGKPFLPYVFYKRQETGELWHDSGRRGATRGSLNSIMYWTFAGHCSRDASGSTVITWGLKFPGEVQSAGQPQQQMRINLEPGAILSCVVDPDFKGQPGLQVVGPGANLDTVHRFAEAYEIRQLVREGISGDDLSRNQANPTSAAALSISNSGKRMAALMVEPCFRASDLQALRTTAAMLRLLGRVYPGVGYSLSYLTLPLSAEEQAAEREDLTWQLAQGLISKVDLWLRRHPGAIREDAIRDLQRVCADEAAIEVSEPVEPGAQDPSGQPAPATTQSINLTATDIASIVTVDEARASQGLPPIGHPDGALTLAAYQAKHASTVAAAANATAGNPTPTA